MPLTMNDQHVQSLISSALAPNERVLFKARGVEKPWYSKILTRFGSMFWKHYLVAATDQRIVFVEHGSLLSGYKAKKVDALSWHEVETTKLGWGVFNKNLSVRAGSRNFKKTVVLGRFWMKDNFQSGAGVVQTWSQSTQMLGATRTAGALPQVTS